LEKNKVVGPKICAGGISAKSLNLEIPESMFQRRFNKIIINTPLQKSEIKSKIVLETILRKDLGKWMLKRVRNAGAEVMEDSEVTSIKKNFVIVNKKQKIVYNYLVGADGSYSFVRKYLGLKTEKFLQVFQYLPEGKFNNLEFFLDLGKFAHYVWIFPYKNYASIGTGIDVSKKNRFNFKLDELMGNLNYFCSKKFDTKNCKFEAWIVNYDFKGFEFDNIFLIGDAAGLASGLIGGGIDAAVKSGEDVAKKILDKTYNCPNIKRILSIKKKEEFFLYALEIRRNVGEIELEFLNFILKSEFFLAVLKKLL